MVRYTWVWLTQHVVADTLMNITRCSWYTWTQHAVACCTSCPFTTSAQLSEHNSVHFCCHWESASSDISSLGCVKQIAAPVVEVIGLMCISFTAVSMQDIASASLLINFSSESNSWIALDQLCSVNHCCMPRTKFLFTYTNGIHSLRTTNQMKDTATVCSDLSLTQSTCVLESSLTTHWTHIKIHWVNEDVSRYYALTIAWYIHSLTLFPFFQHFMKILSRVTSRLTYEVYRIYFQPIDTFSVQEH